ncbi:MAG: PLDc N-terminal domain-containing protein [Deltaproteobacteria bacterium]|nr:PLDc N-terminal domain-containing protein [Deltaproteobacteria bacterium]
MPPWEWLSLHHAASVVTFALTLMLVARVLRSDRPASGSAAWLLGIVLVPYVGIPLYLMLGNRKLRNVARKPALMLTRGVPAAGDNPVVWLDAPGPALQQFLDEIAAAQRTIHVSTFILGNDPAGRAIVLALAARAAAGVEVCLLLDGLFAPRSPRDALAALEAAGGRVAVFLPLIHLPWRGRSNVRNHRKVAVFDGERAIVGGMNLTDDCMGAQPRADRWRDLSIVVTREAAAALAGVFRADWAFASGRAVALVDNESRAAAIDVIPTGPDCAGDPWHDAVLQLIFDARTRVLIATPYFAPDDSLRHALVIAARRGVAVTIVTPARSNHWISDRVAGPMLREVAAAGVTVMRYRPGMLHAKCLLIDDAIAAVGSANFNARSLFLDFEVSLVLRGAEHNQRMAAWFAATLADCEPGPPIARGLRRPIEAVVRLLAPIA